MAQPVGSLLAKASLRVLPSHVLAPWNCEKAMRWEIVSGLSTCSIAQASFSAVEGSTARISLRNDTRNLWVAETSCALRSPSWVRQGSSPAL